MATPETPGSPALLRFTTALIHAGSATSDGRDWTCPAHADTSPSLSVTYDTAAARVVFHCHAGCAGSAVLGVLALTTPDLCDVPRVLAPAAPVGPVPAWASEDQTGTGYQYVTAAGDLVFTVFRRLGPDGKKTFRQQAADGTWSIRGVEPVLFNLPNVIGAVAAGVPVHLVEGEKDCTALSYCGLVGTTNPGGSKKWRDALAEPLEGASLVVVWRDRDWLKGDDPDARTPGDDWARAVVDSLARRGIPYRVVESAAGKDAWDHLAAGYSVDQAVPVELKGAGGPELEGAEVVPASDTPMPVARHLERDWRDATTGLPVRFHWRGAWLVWTGAHWREEDAEAFRSRLFLRLEHAVYEKPQKDGPAQLVSWNPSTANVNTLQDAARAVCHLDPEIEAGSRYVDGAWVPPAGARVAFSNGVLDVTTRAFTAPSPAYLNTSSVPFEYRPDAPAPLEWLTFLRVLWPDDVQSVDLLQEWFGYVISGRTDFQKALFIQGPPRSGKGLVARIMKRLVGKDAFAGPTLAGLAENFGMASLVGKSLAGISDMRMPERNAQLVLERLLSITGEDTLTVDRKHKSAWIGQLPVRLMMMSNNLPGFRDPSGAFASRLLLLHTTESFLGREDLTLEGRITPEMHGIVNWALEGLDRLQRRGRFVVPQSSQETLLAMHDAASPLSAFLRERCERGPATDGYLVPVDDLYRAWVQWGTQENGQSWSTTKQRFGLEVKEVSGIGGPVQRRDPSTGMRVRYYTGVRLQARDVPVTTSARPFIPVQAHVNPFEARPPG